jgi:ATP-dependent RNA helicase MRH4
MPGLLSSLKDVIGSNAKPTPIQALSLKHLFGSEEGVNTVGNKCKQILLASETGSGKSIAYLLPVLQALKVSELRSRSFTGTPLPSLQRSLNPRALILAPTHELSRQLAGFAKALLHAIKLRVVCASRANARSYRRTEGTASKMAEEYGAIRGGESETREFDMQRGTKTRPVDVVVGTPMKVLEMTRGRGWDQEPSGRVQHELDFNEKGRKIRSQNVRKGEPEMGLTNVEWVIVDEADVLFGEQPPSSIYQTKNDYNYRSRLPRIDENASGRY